jgi:Fic family protein
MKVTKILTFQSGNFPLSYNYSQTKTQTLEIEFRFLCSSLKELPILPDQAQDFEQELTRRSIFSTAAIEGNPLQEDEVAEIISSQIGQEYKEEKKIEIKNLQKAYKIITDVKSGEKFDLSENFIKNIHHIIADKLHYDSCVPGYYRNHAVKVGDKQHGGIATPPKCLKDIENLMAEYIEWFNTDCIQNLSPIIRAALAHYHLALIHPFGDGNGRTARLVEAAILRAAGVKYLPVMLSNYYYREIDSYFTAFSQCRKSKEHDLTPFIQFVLKGAVDSLHEVKGRITSYIRTAALKNYFQLLRFSGKISARQHELLALLLQAPAGESVTINHIQQELPYRTLYAAVSYQTARRDLTKLHELRLLKIFENTFQLDREILNAL